MPIDIPDEYRVEHYPSGLERSADWWIHTFAITAAAAGAVALIATAVVQHRQGLILAAALYGAALIAMLAFSAVYNFSRISPLRPFLLRLDETGIFLMIAGSYTPFTTQVLHGPWAIGMTTVIWTLAFAGIMGKLVLPQVSEKVWTALYIALGWVAIIAFQPLSQRLPFSALALLVAGSLVYTSGCWVFLNGSMRFRRAVWHGFVTVGAGLHYTAILLGVVAVHGRA